MVKKPVTFDFYKVEVTKQTTTFEQILADIGALPDDESRNVELPTGVYRLTQYSSRGNRQEGELIRIRMTDIPVRARLSGGVADIDLLADEGVGEQTAFLYDSAKEVLVLQRNRSGVGRNTFVQYFNQAGGASHSIYLPACVNTNALERMANMDHISKFEYAIAAPSNMDFLDRSNKAMNGTMDLVEYFQAPYITVTISRGHSSSYPSETKIGAVVKKLLKSDSEYVTKLRVVGAGTDERAEPIDFLLDRIHETASVKYDDKRRRLPYGPRRTAIRQAIDKWYDEL